MKLVFIDEIDNRQMLFSNVKNELKSCGVKISKSKIKLKSDNVTDTGLIFGNWLCFLQCCDVPNCGKVPSFLIDTLEQIEKNIAVEGLFRKPGSTARLKELRQVIDEGGSIDNANPLDLACLLKQFFRELPDSLLPASLDEPFLRCCGLPSVDRIHSLLQLCLLLPDQHLAVLRYIMQFLCRVTAHSAQNKMDAANLAICLTPSLLHNCLRGFDDKTMATSGAEGRTLKLAIDGIHVLIEHADRIGMVEEHYVEHMGSASKSCLYSDDDTERNDDYLNRRRKKRSTSLQGLVTNLSSSFTKWRRNSRGHNSSSISNHSTLSCASSYPLGDDVTIVAPPTPDVRMDHGFGVNDLTDVTPRVMRKRKSNEDEAAIAFSANKKKAILQTMPLAGTPSLPMTGRRNGIAEYKKQPTIAFTDDTELIFSATPSRPRVEQFLAAASAAKVASKKTAKTSPVANTVGNSSVKKSVKKFFRRLSSGKDSEADSSHLAGGAATASGKRHKKTPSSPARLVTYLLPPDNSPLSSIASAQQHTRHHGVTAVGTPSSCHQPPQPDSASSLHRGQPNSVRSGLPAPVHVRRHSHAEDEDTAGQKKQLSMNADTVSSVLAASPILHRTCSETEPMFEEDTEETNVTNGRGTLLRCSSGSVSSFDLDASLPSGRDLLQPEAEVAHDVAFLQESLLVADGANCTTESNQAVKESSLLKEVLGVMDDTLSNPLSYVHVEESRVETAFELPCVTPVVDDLCLPSTPVQIPSRAAPDALEDNKGDSVEMKQESNHEANGNIGSQGASINNAGVENVDAGSKFKDFRFVKPVTLSVDPHMCFTSATKNLMNRARLLEGRMDDDDDSANVSADSRMPRESILNLKDSGRVAARIGEYNNRSLLRSDAMVTRRGSVLRVDRSPSGRKAIASPVKAPSAFLQKSNENTASNEGVIMLTPTIGSRESFRSPKIPISTNMVRNVIAAESGAVRIAPEDLFRSPAATPRSELPCSDTRKVIDVTSHLAPPLPPRMVTMEHSGEEKRPALRDNSLANNIQFEPPSLVTIKVDAASPLIKQKQLTHDLAVKYSHAARLQAAESGRVGLPVIGAGGFKVSPARRVKRLKGSPVVGARKSPHKTLLSPAKLLGCGGSGSKHVSIAKWDI